MIVGRYAPSPTGSLHYGNLRTALLCWLQVRLAGGEFILRIDDLDQPRNQAGSLDNIIEDLKWLGIDWDYGPGICSGNNEYLQSQRTLLYNDAFKTLQKAGLIYPCRCSRKDIALASSAPHADDMPGAYPGTCRPQKDKTNPAISKIDTMNCAWRFTVTNQTVSFVDQIHGPYSQQLETEVGDFVVKRKDGLFAYQLATVVDDGLMGVTDVVRGADLTDSTPRQIALFNALGFNPPRFWHVPLMKDDQGKRMSKRDGSKSVCQWRNQSKTPEELVGQLAQSAGLIEQNEAISCENLLSQLNPESFRQRLQAHT